MIRPRLLLSACFWLILSCWQRYSGWNQGWSSPLVAQAVPLIPSNQWLPSLVTVRGGRTESNRNTAKPRGTTPSTGSARTFKVTKNNAKPGTINKKVDIENDDDNDDEAEELEDDENLYEENRTDNDEHEVLADRDESDDSEDDEDEEHMDDGSDEELDFEADDDGGSSWSSMLLPAGEAVASAWRNLNVGTRMTDLSKSSQAAYQDLYRRAKVQCG
jgi:hypothetical protein